MDSTLLSYLVLIPVTLVTAAILVILFIPRLLIPLLVRLVVLFSKFGSKRYIKVDKDIWASYLERGSLETCKASILFLHGYSGSGVDFVNMLPRLDESYHVVALDLLNHGSSTCLQRGLEINDMIQFVKKFVEKVGLHRRKFHLVSFSMGGAISTIYATKYPDDLASLTLAAPPVVLIKPGPEFDLLDLVTYKDNEEFLKILDVMSSGKMKHPPPLIVRALVAHKNYVAPNMIRVKNSFGIAFPVIFTVESLIKIQTKTLILWGENDKVCLPEGADFLKENIPNSRVKIIKDCGHVMFITHVKEVAAHLNKWLSQKMEESTVPKTQGLKPSLQGEF